MAALVDDAKDTITQIVLTRAGRDANIAVMEADLEGVRGGIEATTIEVITHLLRNRAGIGQLLVDGERSGQTGVVDLLFFADGIDHRNESFTQ